MNSRYLVIFSCFLWFSCGKETVIEEKLPELSLARKQKEEQSVDLLSSYLTEIKDKTQVLSDFDSEINQELQEINQLFQALELIDLFDVDQAPNMADSEKYHQFYQKNDALLAKIAAKNYPAIYQRIFELAESSLVEEKLLTDSLSVRKQVDQISNHSLVAKDKKKNIDDDLALLQSQKKSLSEKIDHASMNFTAQFGDRGAILAELQTKANNAQSITNINTILAEPLIFSLEAEIKADRANGPSFFLSLEKMPSLFSQLKKQAQEAKTNIDEQLLSSPTKQQDLENLARNLDLSLENRSEELVSLTSTSGIKPAHLVRKTALDLLLNPPNKNTNGPGLATPPPSPGAPPPPSAGSIKIVRPNQLLANFKETIAANSSVQPNQVETSIKSALNKLADFYEAGKLAKIKAAVSEAKNPQFYRTSYQKLYDLLSLYTINGIKNKLLSDDEILFNNKLSELRNYLSPSLLSLINGRVKDLIGKRVELIKVSLNSRPNIRELDDLVSQLEKAKTIDKISQICASIKAANHIIEQKNCDLIRTKFEVDSANFSSPTDLINALRTARKNIEGNYVTFKEKINLAINKTEFFTALDDLNSILNTKITPAELDSNNDYDVKIMVNNVIDSIASKTVNINSEIYNYKVVIEEFSNLLSPTMTDDEIDNIGKKLAKGSKYPLAKSLAAVLSSEAYLKFTAQFSPPSNEMIVTTMKNTALKSLLDFEQAIKAVDEAKDDLTSAQALDQLAQFFSPDLANKIKLIMLLTASILSVDQQFSNIKNQTQKNPAYLVIKDLAEIDENNLNDIIIISESNKLSLAAQESELPLILKDKIPVLFNILEEFKYLKENLLRSLSALALSSPPAGIEVLAIDKTNIEPIVNAFSLIFSQVINKLYSLNFDDSDSVIVGQIIEQIKAPYFATYISKFKKFKSVVGEKDRDLINKLKEINTKLVLKTSPESIELLSFINKILE